MAIGRWIGGALGGLLTGGSFLGMLAGYFIGKMFEGSDESSADQPYSAGPQAHAYGPRQQQAERNDFLFSMLVLASYIIRADGRVMHSEMETVRRMLRQNFGEAAVTQGDQVLRHLFSEQDRMGMAAFSASIQQSCWEISRQVDYSTRLQLLNFLVMVAQADGSVPPAEEQALKDCARWMGMGEAEVDSMLHLKGDSLDDAYKVLGVSPTATDDELRKAYRKLALQHHPDRVAKLGEDVKRAAEKKFQEINAAKERIWKARGL